MRCLYIADTTGRTWHVFESFNDNAIYVDRISADNACSTLLDGAWSAILIHADTMRITETLVQQIKEAAPRVPVVALATGQNAQETADLLSSGADDVISESCDGREVCARIWSVVRRSAGYSHSTMQIDGLQFNLQSRQTQVVGLPVHLTNAESSLLEALMLRRGKSISRKQLLKIMYGNEQARKENTIDVLVGSVRKKLSCGLGRLHPIETVNSRRYRVPAR